MKSKMRRQNCYAALLAFFRWRGQHLKTCMCERERRYLLCSSRACLWVVVSWENWSFASREQMLSSGAPNFFEPRSSHWDARPRTWKSALLLVIVWPTLVHVNQRIQIWHEIMRSPHFLRQKWWIVYSLTRCVRWRFRKANAHSWWLFSSKEALTDPFSVVSINPKSHIEPGETKRTLWQMNFEHIGMEGCEESKDPKSISSDPKTHWIPNHIWSETHLSRARCTASCKIFFDIFRFLGLLILTLNTFQSL